MLAFPWQLRMRGLPYRATEDDIRAFFKSEVHNPAPQLNILKITLEAGSDGRSNGEAIVQFSSEVEAERALSFDKEMMGHRWEQHPVP
jgi:RNA recognition motif-containing protein